MNMEDERWCINKVAHLTKSSIGEAGKIVEKAVEGREILKESPDYHTWFHQRFAPSVVEISFDEYSRTAIDALKILSSVAATDFGSSRQRDFGQLWGDMTRGYLAESAFQIFLRKHGIDSKLAHEKGKMEDFLESDIPYVKTAKDDSLREARTKVGIKGTKWNGIWLDIPGDQYSHSDYHVLVKVGVHRDHLFGYFRSLGFIDRILEEGRENQALVDPEEISLVSNIVPEFKPISAYICGFVRNTGPAMKIQTHGSEIFDGKLARMHYTIHTWKGVFNPGDLEIAAKLGGVTHENGRAKFQGIGSFSNTRHTVFNTGSLRWKKSDWKHIFSSI